MALHIVTGSPGCGKSTWVRNHTKPGDIRIGSDEITNTLIGKSESKHHHEPIVKKISRAAREAAITEAIKNRSSVDVYILISNLNKDEEAYYRRHQAKFIIIDPGYDVAMQRCKDNRPGYKHRLVDAWYSRQDQWPRDAQVINPDILIEESVAPEPEDMPPAARGGATIRVVTGPPAAGKSTFIRTHRKSGDVTIDFDTLANELAGVDPANHEHPQHIKTITRKARQAAIDAAVTQSGDHTVWVIHSSPSDRLLERYRRIGATIDVVDPGKTVVMSRCKTERPRGSLIAAAKWYDDQKTKTTKSTTERGYGWKDHQQPREILLNQHREGTPCYWCGLPMHGRNNYHKNWDKKALAGDHPDADGAKKRMKPTRLLHFTCNSQRQRGDNDDLRPAVTGKHPSEPLPTPANTSQLRSTAATGQVVSGFDFNGVTFGS